MWHNIERMDNSMSTAEATFYSALALSAPLWGSVLIGKLIERRQNQARQNHPTNKTNK
jgi:hypothetical protein